MNNKSLLVAALVVGLFLAALIFRDGTLILLAMPFLTYMMFGVLKLPKNVNLKVARTLDRASTAPLEPIEMKVLVENADVSQVILSLQESLFPSMQLLEGQLKKPILLSPGEQFVLKYTFCAGRGIYSWPSVRVVASDPFSLFELHLDFPTSAEILIHPDPMKLSHIPLRLRFTRHIPGSIPARLPGSGTDFFGIREYRAGDPLRRIHWRMTAQHPHRLFTKEFEQAEVADIGLILDTRNLNGNHPGGESLFDHAVRATASLAEVFLREGNRVGLLIYGERMVPLFPGSGRRQLHRIYRSLAQASTRRSISLEYLGYFSSRLFPNKSLIFMISSLGNRDLPVYQRLCAAGYQVILISPDPVEYAAKKMPATQAAALAYRASKIERYIRLSQLVSMGVQVVDWPVDQSLNSIIHESLSNIYLGHIRYAGR
jgi:uncharacterized protein (DUF58 family)